MSKQTRANSRIEKFIRNPELTCKAIVAGYRHAAIYHRAFGYSMAGLRDGKLVVLGPEEFPIPEEDPEWTALVAELEAMSDSEE